MAAPPVHRPLWGFEILDPAQFDERGSCVGDGTTAQAEDFDDPGGFGASVHAIAGTVFVPEERTNEYGEHDSAHALAEPPYSCECSQRPPGDWNSPTGVGDLLKHRPEAGDVISSDLVDRNGERYAVGFDGDEAELAQVSDVGSEARQCSVRPLSPDHCGNLFDKVEGVRTRS